MVPAAGSVLQRFVRPLSSARTRTIWQRQRERGRDRGTLGHHGTVAEQLRISAKINKYFDRNYRRPETGNLRRERRRCRAEIVDQSEIIPHKSTTYLAPRQLTSAENPATSDVDDETTQRDVSTWRLLPTSLIRETYPSTLLTQYWVKLAIGTHIQVCFNNMHCRSYSVRLYTE